MADESSTAGMPITSTHPSPRRSLDAIFTPKSVAVIGATELDESVRWAISRSPTDSEVRASIDLGYPAMQAILG